MGDIVFTQWKVVGPSDFGTRTKTYDNLKTAKVEYGKACKVVEEDGEGKALLFARTTFTGEWICIQELEYDDDEEEDDDDDDDDDVEDDEPKSKRPSTKQEIWRGVKK